MKNQPSNFKLALKGMAMGIAEVIPGVSGGTIAFITGIYEKLINTIKAFSPALILVFKKAGVKGVWTTINGNFLTTLLIGMAAGVVLGVFGVTHILETYPQLLWAFFFGLIIASSIYIGKQVEKWDIVAIISLILGIAVAYYITVASPAQGNEALWFVFISGMIAISALILPGISGSFILLLMGMYTFIIPTVKSALSTFDTQSLIIVGVFGMGCLVGLATFSRVLSWTFKNYRNPTLALLTGFMIGSLNKLWPWRNVLEYREQSVMPSSFEGEAMVIGAIISMIFGFIIVFGLEKLDTSEHE
jgi:putative membrane protein